MALTLLASESFTDSKSSKKGMISLHQYMTIIKGHQADVVTLLKIYDPTSGQGAIISLATESSLHYAESNSVHS